MSILDRIRLHGGDVVWSKWAINLRRGKLSDDAVSWIKDHKDDLMHEVWPEYDDWQERAAIMEYDAGMTREEAEEAAYRGLTC